MKFINTFDKTDHLAPIMRLFVAEKDQRVALVGTDASDHALWRITGDKAELVGTLTEDQYKHVRRSRVLNLSIDNSEQFEWVRKEFSKDNEHCVISGRVSPHADANTATVYYLERI